jgi:hypothetical protein
MSKIPAAERLYVPWRTEAIKNKKGERYGTLLVIKPVPPSSRHTYPKETHWLCYCRPEWEGCGKTKEVRVGVLNAGNKGIKSCGCRQGIFSATNGKQQKEKSGGNNNPTGYCGIRPKTYLTKKRRELMNNSSTTEK